MPFIDPSAYYGHESSPERNPNLIAPSAVLDRMYRTIDATYEEALLTGLTDGDSPYQQDGYSIRIVSIADNQTGAPDTHGGWYELEVTALPGITYRFLRELDTRQAVAADRYSRYKPAGDKSQYVPITTPEAVRILGVLPAEHLPIGRVRRVARAIMGIFTGQ